MFRFWNPRFLFIRPFLMVHLAPLSPQGHITLKYAPLLTFYCLLSTVAFYTSTMEWEVHKAGAGLGAWAI
jgi:hypothetical protein